MFIHNYRPEEGFTLSPRLVARTSPGPKDCSAHEAREGHAKSIECWTKETYENIQVTVAGQEPQQQ
tara:strand:- start:10 stop:207 length:198 start_codon:yes stop_codon:yes gene_type:complete